MNACTLAQTNISSQDGEIAMNCRAFAKIEIAANDRGIARNRAAGIDHNGTKGDSDITGYVTMKMNGTESTGDVASRFSLSDGDVGAETGSVISVAVALRLSRCCENNDQSC
jgi:hypothetical protein